MFSSCLWAFVDSARSCVICHQLGRGGGRVFRPWTFFVVVQKWSRDSNPFFFPLRSLIRRLYIVSSKAAHIREREMRLLRVSYSIYYILWPRNPVDDTSLIVPTVPQGIGSPFFFLSQTTPEKNQKWCQGNSAPSVITLISWRYYIKYNAGRCCCSCGGATVKWNSAYYVITQTHIQERYWEIWKSWLNNRLQKRKRWLLDEPELHREQRERELFDLYVDAIFGLLYSEAEKYKEATRRAAANDRNWI
jgi:hypothetical protein